MIRRIRTALGGGQQHPFGRSGSLSASGVDLRPRGVIPPASRGADEIPHVTHVNSSGSAVSAPSRSDTRKAIPIVSFFAGPGGLDLGFRLAGFVPVLALDANEAAVGTYNGNDASNVARRCDLGRLSKSELLTLLRASSSTDPPRGVIAGPPCQAFSNGNTLKKRRDPRAALGLVFARLVGALNEEFGLDFFVFENVVGLTAKRHRHRFATIKRALEAAGFNIFVQVLDASTFGVPQTRRRLVIVGINRKKFPAVRFEFPNGTSLGPTVRDVIGGLPDPVLFSRGIRREDIPFHPNHWTMYPRSEKFRKGMHGNGRSFKRLAWDRPSYTVAYGNREIHIHPEGKRRLSVFEAMLLQGFPSSYELFGSLSAQISQVSDAVPPPLAEAVAQAIRRSLYEPVEALQTSLLRWFEKHQRQFSWRRTRDPFKILVAEKLLQQTAATEAVSHAYDEIVGRYSNSHALANASKRDLQRIVKPLGLVYRASEFQRLARAIRDQHSDKVPRDMKKLLALPGVGDYCARAVLSFAFGERWAIVDTNVARFLHRYFGLNSRWSQNPARDKHLQRLADGLVPAGASRSFNVAVLDLCAAHCKARQPQCLGCPVRAGCAFSAEADASLHPSTRQKRSTRRTA